MYRQSLNMTTEGEQQQVMLPDAQFVKRVGSLPIVTSTMEHLYNVYNSTKNANNLVKYTLETAESSVKTLATTAAPIVGKLEAPITRIDSIACDQLDKLEQKYPIINKPTEQWVEGTQAVYDSTLKPTVERVSAIKDYGVHTVNGVKSYTTTQVDNAKQYGVDTLTSVRDKSVTTVGSVAAYSNEKLQGALQTPYGRKVVSHLDHMLDITESYLDYYLPEEEKTEGEEERTESQESCRAVAVGDKARRRMYSRAMRDLQQVQLRTKETLEKLDFTVDLIQYAKTNMDGVQEKMTAVPAKFRNIWDEINKTDEEVEAEEMSKDPSEITPMTFETRAIATGRHMTLKLKRSVATLSSSLDILPASLKGRVTEVRTYTEELYNTFANAGSFKDLPSRFLEQTKNTSTYIQETLDFVLSYLQTTRIASWIMPRDEKCEELEMETLRDKSEMETEVTEEVEEEVAEQK